TTRPIPPKSVTRTKSPRTSSGSTPKRCAMPAATPPAQRSWVRQMPSCRTEAKKPPDGCGGVEGVCGALWPFIGPANPPAGGVGIRYDPDPSPGRSRAPLGTPWNSAPTGPHGHRTCDHREVTTQRLPLRRPLDGRHVGGVCAGLALHLGLPVQRVRVAFVVAAMAFGAGLVLYGWLWVFVPAGDPAEAVGWARPSATVRLRPRLRRGGRAVAPGDLVIGMLLLLAALALLLWRAGVSLPNEWLVPLLVVVGGAALVWTQLDSSLSG